MSLLNRLNDMMGLSARPQAGERVQAVWHGTVVAESDQTVVVEGNHYFPQDSLRRDYVEPSDHTSRCSWKGRANYFTLVVDGERNRDAAWVYRDPKPAAEHVRDRVAFWRGVKITPVPSQQDEGDEVEVAGATR